MCKIIKKLSGEFVTPEEQNEMYSHVEKLVNKGIWYSTYESYYFKAGAIFVRIHKSKHQ